MTLSSAKTKVIELIDHEFVRVSGSDALSFLQGQITANMDRLEENNCLSAALCNLKGRVIADFRVILREDDCILQTTKGMAAVIIATLSKYAVFSKVELSRDESITARGIILKKGQSGIRVGGFESYPEQSNQCLQNSDALLLKVEGEQRFEVWNFNNSVPAVEDSEATTDSSSISDWLRGDICSGTIHVQQSISEAYTPQLLNYDISGVVDFDKGCYTGQEIVARMHYRGKAKKRLFLLRLKKAAITAPCERTVSFGDGAEQIELEILSAVSYGNDDGSSTETGSLALAVMSTGVSSEEAGAEACIIELVYS